MSTQLGTFIPLQGQNACWGLNNNLDLRLTGINPQAILGQNTPYGHSSFVVLPTNYAGNFNEITKNIAPTQSPVAFVPHQQSINSGAFIPNTFMGSSAVVATVPGIFQGSNSSFNCLPYGNTSISQSFATELSENNHEYVISFDVPGIEMQDLDISLAGNTIYINGIRKNTQEATTLAYSEIAKGSISRAICVPFDVCSNKAINTSLDNGVLKIRISKDNQFEKKGTTRKVKIG
ncbi:MAG: Hsp20/alpha crystallin family protein [Alphaproteobacteria bacterium]|nr:Hsp20/alpha crystallin family protein [Alphaproteobacteria bacterium]